MSEPQSIGCFLPKARDNETLTAIPQKAKELFFGYVVQQAREAGVNPEPAEAFRTFSDFACEFIAYYGECYKRQYLPPKRGLVLVGERGSGKTVLARFFASLINRHFSLNTPFLRFTRCYEVMDAVMAEPDNYVRVYRELYKRRHYVFDDLGPEGNAQCYGLPFGMREVLTRRYDEWIDFGTLTVLTTNLISFEEIAKRYGDRIEDRFFEMYDFVLCSRDSQRWKTWLDRIQTLRGVRADG